MAFDPNAYLAKKQASSNSGGFNPDAYLAKKFEPPPQEQEDNRGLLSKGVDYGLRALDYPAGIVRTAGAGIANIPYSIATGKSITRPEDVTNAFKGQAPTSAQYLERAGLEEGPSVDVPVIGKISTRDTLGFGLDVASDPLGPMVRSVGLLAKGSKSAGKSMYKSGLKKIDEKLIEKGTKPISETLIEHGAPTGTTKKLTKDVAKIGEDLLNKRDQIYKEVNDLGAQVDISAATKSAQERIAKLRDNPGFEDMANKLSDYVDKYRSHGFVDVQTASDWKSQFYNSLPDSAFDKFGKLKGPAKEIEKDLARGFKDGIESAADFVRPGAGKEISDINKGLSSVIQSKKPMAMQVRRATTPNALTTVDAIVGSSGLLHSPMAAGGMLAAKKAADLSKTTWARTKAGKGLMNLSKVPYLDQMTERGLINANRDDE